MVVGDCATQRNLSAEGRDQAQRIGSALRARGVTVGEVWHSQWCRTRDTAQLAFPTMPSARLRAQPVFNSFFSDREQEARSTKAARELLLSWPGSGTLVVVTHQVNITALTGVFPQSGEGVVLLRKDQTLEVLGSVLP